MTEDLNMLEELERYFNGQLTLQEKELVNQKRKSDPALDQLYAEYFFFLNNLEQHGNVIRLKSTLKEVTSSSSVSKSNFTAPILELWRTHKKTVAVAASVAIIFSSISVSVVNKIYSPVSKNGSIKPLVEKNSSAGPSV